MRAFARAVDSAVTAGTSARVRGPGAVGRVGGVGPDQRVQLARAPSSASTRALAIVASILARLRMMPASASSRSRSASVNAATDAILKPAKAARKPSRRRRIVIQDRPDWKASRQSRSNRASSPWTGRPHSSSWYADVVLGGQRPRGSAAAPSGPGARGGAVASPRSLAPGRRASSHARPRPRGGLGAGQRGLQVGDPGVPLGEFGAEAAPARRRRPPCGSRGRRPGSAAPRRRARPTGRSGGSGSSSRSGAASGSDGALVAAAHHGERHRGDHDGERDDQEQEHDHR